MANDFDMNQLSTLHRLCYLEPTQVPDYLAVPDHANSFYELSTLWNSSALHWMAASTDPASPDGMAHLAGIDRQILVHRDETGALPLHWAARWGSLENLVHLATIDTPAEPAHDQLGREVVHWYALAPQNPFAGAQKLEFMTSQMATRLDARDKKFGGTPLHWAAALGGDVRTLVARMPDLVHEVDNRGATPLHWLAATGVALNESLPLLLAAGTRTDTACQDGTIIEELIRPDQQEIWVQHLATSRPSQPPM